MTEETWKDVLNYEGIYKVSSYGRIKRLKGSVRCPEDRLLNPRIDRDGYETVWLSKDAKAKYRTVHSIVCEAFHGPRPYKRQAAHSDGNKVNNQSANLSWKTQKENAADKVLHGTHLSGERHPHAKLSDKQAEELKRRYKLGGEGNKPGQLAKEYGITLNYVSMLANGKRRNSV